MVIELLTTALGSSLLGAGGVAGILKVIPANRRMDAESSKVLAQAYGLFVDDLRAELSQVRAENSLLRERVASLEAHISGLLQERRDKIQP